MKEWIGYYEDVLSNELSENIALNSKGWKQSLNILMVFLNLLIVEGGI